MSQRNFVELIYWGGEVMLGKGFRTAKGERMTEPIPASEKDLLERIKAGDEDAFIALYRDRRNAVHKFALQMGGSQALAEDVTQEVFMALIHEVKSFDPSRGSLSSYLYGMARNMVIDYLKRGNSHVSITEAEFEERNLTVPGLITDGDMLGDLTREEAVANLRSAVLALPEHYREVVVLCDLHEMNYDQAAESLGLAVGTVRSRLHRARDLLLKKLTTGSRPRPGVPNLKPSRCEI